MHPTGDEPLLAGRYRLIGLLGRGGMAEVYDAFDERLDRPVAVKLLRPEVSGDPAREARFAKEARSAARLSHPNVVAVYDSGQDQDRAFLVMERLPGTTLSDRIKEEGQLEQGWLANLADEVLAALGAAHDQGLVHRDIKPGNILLTDDGRAKVGDFGIAKTYRDDQTPDPANDLTATGLILGTVAYLSPEQIDGQPASPQSDLYALGVVLYEALTGVKPFRGSNAVAQAHAAVSGHADPIASLRPAVNPALAEVVAKAMARRPEDRYRSAREMRAALESTGLVTSTATLADPMSTTVMPQVDPGAYDPTGRGAATTEMAAGPPLRPGQPVPEEEPERRRRWIWAVVIALIVLALAGGIAYAIFANQSNPPASPTTTSTSTTSTTQAPTSTTQAPTSTTQAPTTTGSPQTTGAPSTTAPPTTSAPSTTAAPTTTTPGTSGTSGTSGTTRTSGTSGTKGTSG